jgi:gamma-aminobutyric acid type B receptor
LSFLQQLSLDIITNPGAVLPALRAVNFSSLTGNYAFDNLQNRVMPFDLIQIQNTTLTVVGKTNIDLKVVQLSGIIWPGGVIPLDRDPLIVISISSGILIASAIVGAVGCIAVLCVTLVLYNRRGDPAVKASSPFFMFIILLGCFLVFVSLPLMAIDRGNASSIHAASLACRAFQFIFSLGVVMVFSALLAKSWRIHAIFRSEELTASNLTDDVVLKWVLVLVAIDVIINIIWSSIDPLIDILSFSDPFTAQCSCRSQSLFSWIGVAVGYKGLVMLTTCVIAFRIRNAPAKFNESKQIFAAVYQLAFIAVILIPLAVLVTDLQFATIAKLLGITFATFATLIILFVPIFIADESISGSGSGSGSGVGVSNSATKRATLKPSTSRIKSTPALPVTDSQQSADSDLSNNSNIELGLLPAMVEKAEVSTNELAVVGQSAEFPSNEKVQHQQSTTYDVLVD